MQHDDMDERDETLDFQEAEVFGLGHEDKQDTDRYFEPFTVRDVYERPVRFNSFIEPEEFERYLNANGYAPSESVDPIKLAAMEQWTRDYEARIVSYQQLDKDGKPSADITINLNLLTLDQLREERDAKDVAYESYQPINDLIKYREERAAQEPFGRPIGTAYENMVNIEQTGEHSQRPLAISCKALALHFERLQYYFDRDLDPLSEMQNEMQRYHERVEREAAKVKFVGGLHRDSKLESLEAMQRECEVQTYAATQLNLAQEEHEATVRLTAVTNWINEREKATKAHDLLPPADRQFKQVGLISPETGKLYVDAYTNAAALRHLNFQVSIGLRTTSEEERKVLERWTEQKTVEQLQTFSKGHPDYLYVADAYEITAIDQHSSLETMQIVRDIISEKRDNAYMLPEHKEKLHQWIAEREKASASMPQKSDATPPSKLSEKLNQRQRAVREERDRYPM